MIIERQRYVDKLVSKKNNGLIKVVIGIRRCGKSFLLSELYRSHLITTGVPEDHIIEIALDEVSSARYRNPIELDKHIRAQIADDDPHYVFLDEIQNVAEVQNPHIDDAKAQTTFVDVLLGLMKLDNVDIYVTGSNSHMLSSDVLTEFRGRGDEVYISPLTYSEFYAAYPDDKRHAWRDYHTYGGMPFVMSLRTHEEKSAYLKDLFESVYLADVIERNSIANDHDILENLLDVVSSSVGSLTNPTRLSNTFRSVSHVDIAPHTISRYLDFFEDAFVLRKAHRYDVKGKSTSERR